MATKERYRNIDRPTSQIFWNWVTVFEDKGKNNFNELRLLNLAARYVLVEWGYYTNDIDVSKIPSKDYTTFAALVYGLDSKGKHNAADIIIMQDACDKVLSRWGAL